MTSDVRPQKSRKGKLAPSKVIVGLILAANIFFLMAPAAHAETRTLKLYFLHTKERAEIAYKRNGRYLKEGLDRINHILRDWRRDEPTQMDPQLLDLLWEVYRAVGSHDYIHVVSAYRSPATNAMLRKRSSGVAKKSQHMLGKAIDFYLPDVKLSRLRAAALKFQVGGVGYYPRSGSPFVHLDVGGVRHWPRMSRQELVSLFPDGKTLHVPSDGKPLPGYEQALASYEARKRNGGTIQVASSSGNRGRGLLAALFGGGADEEEDNAEIAVAQRPARAVNAAPQQSAPPRQQEEEAPAPATILAALPARSVPVPRLAPRPDAAVGPTAPVETAQEPAPEPVEAPSQAPQEEVRTALNVPVPTRRPEYEPAEPVTQIAEADIDLPTPVAYAMPTRRPEHSEPADAIAELLSTHKETAPAAQPVLAAAHPIPDRKQEVTEADAASSKAAVVAALQAKGADRGAPETVRSSGGGAPAIPTASASMTALAGRAEERPQASESVALAGSDDGPSSAARGAGAARTTGKASRVRLRDARNNPVPMVLPVGSRPTERVLSSHSVLSSRPETEAPAFSISLAEAPRAVYTTGFERNATMADARRFTGKAVTFLSLAKFDGE